jgi:glycosyltransferase involved in cell wall biosynthesis
MSLAVSVVIPARNAAGTLGAQLAAVGVSCDDRYEIIVVDNVSTDNTAAVAATFPGVRVVSCPKIGIGAARNFGVRVARGEKILCCDADDVVSPVWSGAMSDALDQFDIVGGPLEFDSLNDPFVRTTRPNLFKDGLPPRDGYLQAIGANIGFRRPVFDALDGFDEAFLFSADDDDFCFRAHQQGYTIGFVPDGLVAYRLRSDARSAARQSANYILAAAQWRAKVGGRQPWKSKVLRAAHHARAVASIWRCRTREGRFAYLGSLASAKAAVIGYRRYGNVAGGWWAKPL